MFKLALALFCGTLIVGGAILGVVSRNRDLKALGWAACGFTSLNVLMSYIGSAAHG